jgi:hypothetical protein
MSNINLSHMKNLKHPAAAAAHRQCMPDHKPCTSTVFMKWLAPVLLVLMAVNAGGQINMADSTSQVVAWWDKNESQDYVITSTKIRVQGNDTISREIIQYDVDITVQDSTESGYLVNWYYHNYFIDSDDELTEKIIALIGDLNIQIRTDGNGAFLEIVNWEEIRDLVMKGMDLVKRELKEFPGSEDFITQMEGMYQSKEAIEASSINEILQFHYFHGVSYRYWQDYSYSDKLANLYGGEPFDAQVTFWLDEMNPDEHNAVYRMHQVVNSEQLTNETFRFLSNIAETMNGPAPDRAEIPSLHNETRLASRIHDSGWVIYSVQTKEVLAQDVVQVEECVIELR